MGCWFSPASVSAGDPTSNFWGCFLLLVPETAYKFQGLVCLRVCAHSGVLLFLNSILEDS